MHSAGDANFRDATLARSRARVHQHGARREARPYDLHALEAGLRQPGLRTPRRCRRRRWTSGGRTARRRRLRSAWRCPPRAARAPRSQPCRRRRHRATCARQNRRRSARLEVVQDVRQQHDVPAAAEIVAAQIAGAMLDEVGDVLRVRPARVRARSPPADRSPSTASADACGRCVAPIRPCEPARSSRRVAPRRTGTCLASTGASNRAVSSIAFW